MYQQLRADFALIDLRISALTLDERGSWKLSTSKGLTVYAGRENVQSRVKRFVKSVQSGLSDRLEDAQRVDLRYSHGFAVRWEQLSTSRFSANPNLMVV